LRAPHSGSEPELSPEYPPALCVRSRICQWSLLLTGLPSFRLLPVSIKPPPTVSPSPVRFPTPPPAPRNSPPPRATQAPPAATTNPANPANGTQVSLAGANGAPDATYTSITTRSEGTFKLVNSTNGQECGYNKGAQAIVCDKTLTEFIYKSDGTLYMPYFSEGSVMGLNLCQQGGRLIAQQSALNCGTVTFKSIFNAPLSTNPSPAGDENGGVSIGPIVGGEPDGHRAEPGLSPHMCTCRPPGVRAPRRLVL
jgi:hypothetical protein